MTGSRKLGRWVVVAIVLVASFAALRWMTDRGGEGSPTGARVSRYLAGPPELASSLGVPQAVFAKTNPPVDLDQLERSARSLTLDRVPLPDDHAIATYRRADTDAEITQVALIYDDQAAVERLDGLASSLLAGAFHLQTRPIRIEGAQDARLWWSEEYLALSFRRGGVAVFVGNTDVGAEEELRALAQTTLERIAASPQPTALPTG